MCRMRGRTVDFVRWRTGRRGFVAVEVIGSTVP